MGYNTCYFCSPISSSRVTILTAMRVPMKYTYLEEMSNKLSFEGYNRKVYIRWACLGRRIFYSSLPSKS